jgi:hypothetical protein
MLEIQQISDNIKTIDVKELLFEIVDMDIVKAQIIDFNTEFQLFKGIDATGVKLEDIGGEYAESTIIEKQANGLPLFPTLRDTGDFYATFSVIPDRGFFTITANTIKDDDDLQDRWGDNLLGLTDENKTILFILIEEILVEKILKQMGFL